MSLRREKPDPFKPQEQYNDLSLVEFNQLATYNAERGRGLLHAAEWQGKMAVLQQRFDVAERRRFEARRGA